MDIMKVDYTSRGAVIALAKSFGKGMTVFKHPDRANYNVTHTSRTDQYQPEWITHQT